MTSLEAAQHNGAEQTHQTQPIKDVVLKQSVFYYACKRAFDIVVSALGLLIMLIPMGIIALCVKCSSPGPAIYRQERLGKGGKPFIMYKFRSMRDDAEKNGPQWAREQDDRCTRVGRALRKYHLDEVPQLWNIFKGDMSFVGPRPERPYFYDAFEKELPEYRLRLKVKPGLTGLSQIESGYYVEPQQRLADDIRYMENMSFWLDMKYIFKTAFLVFGGKEKNAERI